MLRRSPLVVPVVTALAAGFYELMKDQQGAMVISRCLALLSSEQNEVILLFPLNTAAWFTVYANPFLFDLSIIVV